MKVEFLRFGGLSSVPQKGYDASMPGFHSPPARRGIYAFVKNQVEYFLLSGEFKPHRMFWDEKDGEKHAKHVKPKKFTYNGEIWHHLGLFTDMESILEKKGSWVLTPYLDYTKALKKALGEIKQNKKRGINLSKDHMEVFIEKI